MSYLSSPIKKDKDKQEYQKPIKQLCYGHKGLEILKQKTSKKEDILNIIITESMCDSLSLLELKAYNPKNTLLCSTNGTISQNQKELLEYFSQSFTHSQIILGFDNESFFEIYGQKLEDAVVKFSQLAYESGLDGMVCSVFESLIIKEKTHANFLTLTPGIRPFGENSNDQKRVASLQEAKKQRSDFIVVGRPIYEANEPRKICEKILKRI